MSATKLAPSQFCSVTPRSKAAESRTIQACAYIPNPLCAAGAVRINWHDGTRSQIEANSRRALTLIAQCAVPEKSPLSFQPRRATPKCCDYNNAINPVAPTEIEQITRCLCGDHCTSNSTPDQSRHARDHAVWCAGKVSWLMDTFQRKIPDEGPQSASNDHLYSVLYCFMPGPLMARIMMTLGF